VLDIAATGHASDVPPPPALRSTLSTAIVCGSLSVFASIAMIDRVPGAGVAGTCSRDRETGVSIDSGKE
jgi:hypothetical protein